MHDPKPKFFLCLALLLIGLAVAYYGLVEEARIGNEPEALVPMFAGAGAAIIGFAYGIHFARGAYGHAQLRAGRDLVARWWVSAADWNRYRAFDDAREPFAANRVRFRPRIRPDGIEVIVGARSLMVDGSLHIFNGKLGSETPCGVCWFEVAPSCLEIAWTVDGGESSRLEIVRLPVPEAARAQGQRVFDHFNGMMKDERRQWVEKSYGYDFGAHMPKGFEAGQEVTIPAGPSNRVNRKRREAGFIIAWAGAVIAAMVWFAQYDGLMPRMLAGTIATAAMSIAILAAGFTLLFTRSSKG